MAESIIDDELLAFIELLLPPAQAEKLPVSGAQTCCRSSGADWNLVRARERHLFESIACRNELEGRVSVSCWWCFRDRAEMTSPGLRLDQNLDRGIMI